MVCPKGQHQHLGADGETILRCHWASQPHKNPVAQRYHEMALQDQQVYGDVTPKKDSSSKDEPNPLISSIKIFVKKLGAGYTHEGHSLLFFPVTMMLSFLDYEKKLTKYSTMAKKIASQVQMSEEMKVTDAIDVYAKTYNSIADLLPKNPEEDFTEEQVEQIRDVMDEAYQKSFKRLGKKKEELMKKYKDPATVRKMIVCTKEYASWKALDDFLSECEESAKRLSERLEREERKRKLEERKKKRKGETDEGDSDEADEGRDAEEKPEKKPKKGKTTQEMTEMFTQIKAKARGKSAKPNPDPMFG